MESNVAANTNQRGQSEQARMRALVRFNSLTFHSLAAASFLETAVPAQVNRLAQVYAAWPDARLWLEEAWWPRRAELGRQLRAYIEATWPEFEWNAAYEEFHAGYRARSGLETGRGCPVLEALALCVTSAQAALFYRALACCADEPGLRELAGRAASEHGAHFEFFRALFERCKRLRRVGAGAAWRAVAATCRSARDFAVPAALEPLERNWRGTAIVPLLGYADYREKAARLIQRHAALGVVQRLLFRPWLERSRAAAAPVPAGGAPNYLRLAQQAA